MRVETLITACPIVLATPSGSKAEQRSQIRSDQIGLSLPPKPHSDVKIECCQKKRSSVQARRMTDAGVIKQNFRTEGIRVACVRVSFKRLEHTIRNEHHVTLPGAEGSRHLPGREERLRRNYGKCEGEFCHLPPSRACHLPTCMATPIRPKHCVADSPVLRRW